MAPKNFANSREEIMGEIPNLERSQEERELNYEEICKLQSLMVEIQQIFKKEEIVWRQRARINWIREGYLNTAFFHKSASARNKKNVILRLESQGEIIEDYDCIRSSLIHDHFKSIFVKKAEHR